MKKFIEFLERNNAWDKTKEGYKYWRNLNDLWREKTEHLKNNY